MPIDVTNALRVRATVLGLAALLASASLATTEPRRAADNSPDTPLQGPSGVTSLSGQVVDLEGRGLPGVELGVGASHTLTDDQGRFLLTYVIPGKTVLQIDGRRAGPKRDADYGYYQARVNATPGRTTVLPYKSWLPRIDHSHDVTITSPTRSEVVVRNPTMPDFELRIAAGVVIRDVDGRVGHPGRDHAGAFRPHAGAAARALRGPGGSHHPARRGLPL
jgi:hypothetical protein